MSGITSATAVRANVTHSCALLTSGRVTCWGDNFSGKLGNGNTTNSNVPVMVSGLSNATDISAAGLHACASTTDGQASCWGYNQRGALGNGTVTNSDAPVAVPGVASAAAVAAGVGHSRAMLTGGAVQCWGRNDDGQLGNNSTVNSLTQVTVTGISNANGIAAGASHSCATLTAGQARCWGYGAGQLGNGSGTSSLVPVTVIGGACEVAPDPGFSDVSTGAYYYDSVAWLVQAGITSGTSPGKYSPNANVTRAQMAVFLWKYNCGTPPWKFNSLDAGADHVCGVTQLATVACWGANGSGELGNGTSTLGPTPTPNPVTGLANVTAISVGWRYSFALTTDRTVKCWGLNIRGQLGNGTTSGLEPNPTPTPVTGLTDVTDITAGNSHTCAAKTDDTAACWGYGGHGQLGDGTTTNRATPTPVTG